MVWFEAGYRVTVRDLANKVTPFGRLSLNDGTWCMLPAGCVRCDSHLVAQKRGSSSAGQP